MIAIEIDEDVNNKITQLVLGGAKMITKNNS